MSLNRITLKNAQEIVDIYSNLMANNKGVQNNKYSELNGYDIYDIDNSLKLLIALHVYSLPILDVERVKKLKEFAEWGQTGVYQFHMFFIPDDIYNELSKYDYHKTDWIIATNKLLTYGEYISKDYCELMNSEIETMKSFLDYCVRLHKEESDYWFQVYSRLNLIYITNDEIMGATNN